MCEDMVVDCQVTNFELWPLNAFETPELAVDPGHPRWSTRRPASTKFPDKINTLYYFRD